MPDISKITLPSGTVYDIKDATARADIEALQSAIAGGVTFIGETTTALTDGATTTTIVVNGNNVTAKKGDLVVSGNKEFVFDGTKWIEMGDLSAFKALAYKDSASGNYTPTGNVSQPTFTGSATTSTGTFTPDGSVTVTTKSTTNKTAAVSTTTGTVTYTPAGTVTQPTFSGSATTSTGKFTPEGSVAAPTISVKTAGSTTTVNSITAVGTLPSLTTTVANENLTIGFDAGTLPTKGSNTTVKTGDAVYQATAPAFTGTEGNVSVSGTPSGTVSQPTFSGTGVRLVTGDIAVPSAYTATFTGTEGNVSVSGTPSGTVSKPTFSGTQGTVTVS